MAAGVAIAEPKPVESTGFKISREAREWVYAILGWKKFDSQEGTIVRRIGSSKQAPTRFMLGG